MLVKRARFVCIGGKKKPYRADNYYRVPLSPPYPQTKANRRVYDGRNGFHAAIREENAAVCLRTKTENDDNTIRCFDRSDHDTAIADVHDRQNAKAHKPFDANRIRKRLGPISKKRTVFARLTCNGLNLSKNPKGYLNFEVVSAIFIKTFEKFTPGTIRKPPRGRK